MASQNNKYNILYARLSQEDDRVGDSNSIVNQRNLLERYAADNGFENTLFLADDGYSGTNFERPSWKKVVELIEAGEVGTIIVKDLSRLGREYLQVGYLTEIYFPQKNIRFIAIGDGVDSLVEGSTDFNPIRNWANELHAKESSKKSRTVKRMQAERGERLGGPPPYGYKKESADSKKLVPDEISAPVVKHIFELCASGIGPYKIAKILQEEQVVNPSNHFYRQTGASLRGLDVTQPYVWRDSTVAGILKNIAYLGHTRGLRHTTVSYKNKTGIIRPESEQILVKNTHEPIIKQDLWDIVQDVRAHKRRPVKHMDEPNPFSGLLYCVDCGAAMTLFRSHSMKQSNYNFKCSVYGKRGKDACTPHHIRVDDLEKVVLDDLRRVTHFARMKERQFAAYINQKNSRELRKEITALQKELDTMQRRRDELMALFKRVYEDNVMGRITNEQFRMLSGDYNAEQKTLEESIPAKQERLEKLKASEANVEAFIDKAKRYASVDELTPDLLRLFIRRIEIGERSKKYSRSAAQSIRIIYRDIGAVDGMLQEDEEKPYIRPQIKLDGSIEIVPWPEEVPA